jgi:xanthine dehydrogenase/oxidase
MFQSHLLNLVKTLPETQTRGFVALLDNIKYFAGRQIRNVSAISGNICTASPISDLNPVLVALGAILTLESVSNGIRKLPISEFFLGYRKTALKQGEILTSVFIPFTTANQYASAFKQAKRRDDDIAIVNAGFLIEFDNVGSNMVVENSCFAFGGMGAFTMAAKKTCEYMKGKVWSEQIVQGCYPLLLEDLPLSATSPGGQIEFRKSLAQSFLLKFSLRVNDALSKLGHSEYLLDSKSVSALQEIPREISRGEQVYQTSKGDGTVGKPVVHLSASKQVTGEAVYVDDIPKFHNEMYAIIVGSTVAHGYIKAVDTSLAEKAPGFIGWVSKSDCPPADEHGDPNMIGPVFHDEELFATNEVHCMGQMIGLVLAETEAEARNAAKLVKITYEKLPALFTIEDAIKSDSFFAGIRKIETGEFKPGDPKPDLPLSAATHFVEGVARMSAQEHFYLETNVSLCVPQEDGEMEIYASTQQAKETQDFAAHILQVPYHKVVVRIKRLGGGFGGKESRSVFLSTGLALAAKKYKRPVRSMLSREEDMVVTGTRHPFRGEYKVGFTNEGILVSLELNMFANAGYSVDLSWAVMERSMTHCDNAYKIPNFKVHGKICRTNTATNTAFRGFGGPQGMMVAEQYITHVASYLNLPVEHVRRINLYKNGDITHYDMPLESVFLDRAWDELMESSEFQKRKQKVAEFNQSHKYRKRGIAFMPTKFGLAFTVRHMNQAAALVHVYTDGSVRISHGGTEMGQGLHTKMVQVTADALNIPIEMVFISETRTDIVINASPTAASVSSDINGMALKNACDQIMERLKPIRQLDPTMTWPQVFFKITLVNQESISGKSKFDS